MTTGFNLWDFHPVWDIIIALAAIFIAVLVENMLRRKIVPLRRLLLPSPVLGGFLLLFVSGIWTLIFNNPMIHASHLEIITYHGLGLGFTGVALKAVKRDKANKGAQRDIFNSALVTTSTYLLYGVVGVAISVGLFFAIGSFPAAGMLVTMGYGQGPGQAYIWGNIYETAWGFNFGTSFGLALAAASFVSCSIGGAIYLRSLKKKGDPRILAKLSDDGMDEELKPEDVAGPNEIPLSDSVDKLTVQIGLVFLAYTISFGVISLLTFLFNLTGIDLLIETVTPLLWGFNFIFGTLSGIFVRSMLAKFREKGVIKKQYINNMLMDRVSGLFFDIMVIAAIGAINLAAFRELTIIVPLIVLAIGATIAAYFYVRHVTWRLFPKYRDESFLAFYGMLTGTASTGIILLREIDPRFETPAAKNLIYQALWAVLMGFPLLLLMGFAPRSNTWLAIAFGIMVVMFLLFYGIIRHAIKGVEKREDPAEEAGK